MKLKPKFTIRYKFLTVMSLLLASCVSLYLYLAITVFRSDKEQLVFDLNRSMVHNISNELEAQFSSISDKIEIFALTGYRRDLKKEFVEGLLQKNNDIVFVSFWSHQGFDKSFFKTDFLKTYGITKEYFSEKLLDQEQIQEVVKEGETVWNSTLPNGPPLIGYARSVVIEDDAGRPLDRVALVAYISAEKFLNTISAAESTQVFIASRHGEILVHRNPNKMLKGMLVEDRSVFDKALESPLKTGVVQIKAEGAEVLGAFSKLFKGKVFVIAQTDGARAFAVVSDLIRRSLIFSLIVLTVAFLVAMLFSTSLTGPLEKLTEAMNKVSEGDLTTQISLKTKDEIEFLSNTFNDMISDLRQSRHELEEINRDLEHKVKERTIQLEKQNQAVKEAQEALLKTTRLAAVGEIAGRAAHEVLNPLTGMMARLEKVRKRLESQDQVHLKLLEDIKDAWQSDYKTGGFESLLENWRKKSTIHPDSNLWEEDFQNLNAIATQWKSELDSLKKDSDFLLNEGERINKIVGRMRSLSVVKSSQDHCELSELVQKCRDIMADLMEKHEIDFVVDPIPPKYMIRIDKDEFVQSMTNLLRNSQQAIALQKKNVPSHKGRIRIRSVEVEGRVHLLIEDNGIGINETDKLKLFESQFTTKSKEEGTGLGLNISRRFLRAANGDIEFVSSKPGEGTIFKVVLPYMNEGEVAA